MNIEIECAHQVIQYTERCILIQFNIYFETLKNFTNNF
jgi:hypothetical protein